ncbi:MAG TPA: SDR family oxidoreductase [Chloroflexi bacterium]|nr:SDR family oxidoreductase [Chloroflexota bacterium]
MNLAEITKLYDFTGKTALITGGTGALGGEMAVALASLGANVAVLAHRREIPKGMRVRMDAGPGEYTVVYGDVLERDQLAEARQAVEDRFGAVDILINAAGGNRPQAIASPDNPFFDLPDDALGFVFDLNVIGTILPCQIFGKGMAERGEGVILNVSSMTAFTPLTRVAAYSAAKAGVSNFTRWLAVHMAQEYSPRIRVNAIAPGFFIGEQNRALLLNEDSTLTARGRTIIDHTPMGRFGNPEDLLGTVLWLLSPASQFVTGIVVPVDGGFSAYSGV